MKNVIYIYPYSHDEDDISIGQKLDWYREIDNYSAREFHSNDDFTIRVIEDDGNSVTCEVIIPPDKVAPGVVSATHVSDARADFELGRIREFISCTSNCIIINPNGYIGMGHTLRGVEIEIEYREAQREKGTELQAMEFIE